MSNSGASASSIRSLPSQGRTASPQIRDDVFEFRATTAEVLDEAKHLASRADALHDRAQDIHLEDRSLTLEQNELEDLLGALGERGMPWSLVADLVGVSPTAVRKWRRGGEITPDRRARLARLEAFCQIVSELNPLIGDPTLWLQTPIIPGTTILTPADLFIRGAAISLLNRVAQRTKPEELLDKIVPDWRESTRPDDRHQVVIAPDGVPSIVPSD